MAAEVYVVTALNAERHNLDHEPYELLSLKVFAVVLLPLKVFRVGGQNY